MHPRYSRTQRRAQFFTGLCWLVFAAVLLSACSLFESDQETSLQLDFTKVLPEGWSAIGGWREVDIDGDPDTEYLLIFSYDNGQAGAVIYDPQIATEILGVTESTTTPVPEPTVEIVTIPLQPFGYFKPYRLLPSYWAYSYSGDLGQGFVAAPADADSVVVTQVRVSDEVLRASEEVTDEDGVAQAPPSSELVLRGGNTHLTFAWWKDIHSGYGVTQLYAPGGFRGIDWEKWHASPTPITEISGLYPLMDYRARSLLCQEYLYARVLTATDESDSAHTSFAFRRGDSGFKFCEEKIPKHPFYPEGVVMAYILGAREDGEVPADLITPGVNAAQMDADLDLIQVGQEIVTDIATFPTIPVTPSAVQDGTFSPTTTVCVELAQPLDEYKKRWMVFTLKYQPPDLGTRVPDRWTISGVSPAPAPVDSEAAQYCQTILSQQAQP